MQNSSQERQVDIQSHFVSRKQKILSRETLAATTSNEEQMLAEQSRAWKDYGRNL